MLDYLSSTRYLCVRQVPGGLGFRSFPRIGLTLNYSALSDEKLIDACASSAEDGPWTEFMVRFTPIIFSAVSRAVRRWPGDRRQIIEEFTQAAIVNILEKGKLKNYRSIAGISAQAYIRTIVTRFVIDCGKSAMALKHGSGKSTSSIDEQDTPAAAFSVGSPRSMEREVQITELESYLDAVTMDSDHRERDRLMFRLYFRRGLTAGEIASLWSNEITTKGVESVLSRLTRSIRERIS